MRVAAALQVVKLKMVTAQENRSARVLRWNVKWLVFCALTIGYCVTMLAYSDTIFTGIRADCDSVGYAADRTYFVQKVRASPSAAHASELRAAKLPVRCAQAILFQASACV